MPQALPTLVRSVCAEFLPPRELVRPEVLRLLLRRRIAPLVAARAGDDHEVLAALRPYAEAGLEAGAWPLLDDADGYWPAVANAAAAARRVVDLADRAQRDRLVLPRVLIDLEPPLDGLQRLRALPPWHAALGLARGAAFALSRTAFTDAEDAYAALHKALARRRIRALAVAWPTVAGDFGAAPRRAMQRLASAPLCCGWDRIGVLVYGSMIAGWSRGALDVDDARWYAHRVLSRLSRRMPRRTAAFVGLVGHGKLGDEPSYDHPDEIRRDVASARAAGVAEVSLFCLEGVLGRSDPERWLDAFVEERAMRPPFRMRGELLHDALVAGAGVLDAVGRLIGPRD